MGKHAGGMFVAENEMRQHRSQRKAQPFFETVDKVYSYTKIHDVASPTQFRPPRPGGVAFPFRKDELGDCIP